MKGAHWNPENAEKLKRIEGATRNIELNGLQWEEKEISRKNREREERERITSIITRRHTETKRDERAKMRGEKQASRNNRKPSQY